MQRYQQVLEKMSGWTPGDWDSVFDGLDTIFGDEVSHHAVGTLRPRQFGGTASDHEDPAELAQRFRAAITQLVRRGRRDGVERKHPDITGLFERARALQSERLPADPQQARGFLRRLGGVTLELADHLEKTGSVTGLIETAGLIE
ncbi:DUF6415 family natural product biosynthesis protein [Streptomyces murinus]|uniref:DUF6415 family natural product biosynthesis protein n=1 Tax=Streptomyces murinus TaxID=33900 RepID=UPI002E8172C6|nr:DUF6415 family natural product biosynthesis protein [Streptomyces murinus]WUD08379.1 DUF6415 family natural product biosynthesis protein [Streptomyces murinus]